MILSICRMILRGCIVFRSSKDVKPGDKVKVTGKLLTYKNELEIEPSSLEIISSGTLYEVPVADHQMLQKKMNSR